jgi:ferredoxin/flavodoxin
MTDKMKGIIFYYSGSGNTRLACQYVSKKLKNIDLELFNVVRNKEIPELDSFDIVGFATFIDFAGPPFLFEQFIENLPQQKDKLAFVFMTFGFKYGKGLKILAKRVGAKGFRVVTGHILKVPESYPPANVRGIGNVNNPVKWRLKRFNEFILDFNSIIRSYIDGNEIELRKLKISPINRLFPEGFHTPTRARDDMGEKFVDEGLCTECGVCEKGCPYNAIILDPKPKFDMTKCFGCWYCYNHCPEKAIYTMKFNKGHYPRPNDQLRQKLKV